MGRWSRWYDIDDGVSKQKQLNDYGLYQIRAVRPGGKPLPIGRLVGVDPRGILYMGRSGYQGKQPGRTIARRIREFIIEAHSGGIRYAKAKRILRRKAKRFARHRLQVRVMRLPDEEIDRSEARVLRNYFLRHAELPPCNSVQPKFKV